VFYESEYGVGDWTESGEVPSTGGRIKVTWDYYTHIITDLCNEYDTSASTWEEIIEIGGCDERPIEGTDAECTYNDDGTCDCNVYFKEQTPGCYTCPGENISGVTYNKVNYIFIQNCENECEETTVKTYSAVTKEIEACDTGSITVDGIPFTSTTYYNGTNCPETKVTSGMTSISVFVSSANNSNEANPVYEGAEAKIIQKPGPCETPPTPVECTCDGSSVGSTEITLASSAYSTAETTYSESCSLYIENTASGWLDVNKTTGKLEFNSITAAENDRTADVYIKDKPGGNICNTIKVTQTGGAIPTETINVYAEVRYGFRNPHSTDNANVTMKYRANCVSPRINKGETLNPTGGQREYNKISYSGTFTRPVGSSELPKLDVVQVYVNQRDWGSFEVQFSTDPNNPGYIYFDVDDFCCGEHKYCFCD
jgi:hypothetical protein